MYLGQTSTNIRANDGQRMNASVSEEMTAIRKSPSRSIKRHRASEQAGPARTQSKIENLQRTHTRCPLPTMRGMQRQLRPRPPAAIPSLPNRLPRHSSPFRLQKHCAAARLPVSQLCPQRSQRTSLRSSSSAKTREPCHESASRGGNVAFIGRGMGSRHSKAAVLRAFSCG